MSLGEVETDSPSSESVSLPEPLKKLVEADIAFALCRVIQAMNHEEALSWTIVDNLNFDDLNDAAKALQRAVWRISPE